MECDFGGPVSRTLTLYEPGRGQDWETMARLYSKGYLSDPNSKAKSAVLSEEGEKHSRDLFAKQFLAETLDLV